MKKIVLFGSISLLLLSGCSIPLKGKAVRSVDGIVRYDDNGTPERFLEPIRHEDKTLVSSLDEGETRIAQLKNLSNFVDSLATSQCSLDVFFESKKLELKAVEELKSKNYKAALESLRLADEVCADIHYTSGREYYRAIALVHAGRREDAKESARKFLKYSDGVVPEEFGQGDEQTHKEQDEAVKADRVLLSTYRERARNFLEGKGELSLNEESHAMTLAKLPPNSFYAPGGNRREGFLFFPGFGYSSLSGMSFGLSAYKSWGMNGVGGYFFSSAETGKYFAAKLRRSIYESPNRNLNWDAYISARTVKKLSYTYENDGLGTYKNVNVIDEDVAPGIGSGATYRFSPALGVSSELAYYDHPFKGSEWMSSLYSTYYFSWEFGAFGGWLVNRPAIGLTLMFLHLGYDLEDKSILMMVQGLRF